MFVVIACMYVCVCFFGGGSLDRNDRVYMDELSGKIRWKFRL